MARVTVEDCVDRVPNRFDLVLYAAQRAREISSGAAVTLERDDDKNPVVALREIAARTVEIDELGENLIHGLQRLHEADDGEEDVIDFSSTEEEDAIAAAVLGQQGGMEPPAPARAPIDDDAD